MNVARLWKLRQRFGIAAPRVAVRTHVPWYLRWLMLGLLFAASLALALWMYDAGRRFAGFDRSEVEQEMSSLRREFEAVQAELAHVQTVANAAESKIAIERTAQQDLTKQLRAMEAENARLREELAVFESTLSADPRTAPPLSVQRFKVESNLIPGEYRFHLLLLAVGPGRRDFQGHFELIVSLTQDGRDAMITIPAARSPNAQEYVLGFKYFQRVQGVFRVAPGARVSSVQVRVYEKGTSAARATHTVKID